MIAWLVAGQGAEHAGMGLELARSYPPSARCWKRASEAASKNLLEVSELGGRSLLRTEYLQPALTAVALGAASFLRDEGVEPSLVLGHSAGEIGALALSGHLGFEEALHLSAMRGRAMAAAARAQPGGMAAVRGSEAKLHEALELGGRMGAIFHAGQTTADTHLVSGARAALRAAAAADRVSPLPVSGPWHSPLMQPALAELRPLAESLIGDAGRTTTWVSNETGERGPIDAKQTVELLLSQLTRPIRLHRAIEFLLAEGANEIVVLGPHHSLHHILKRHLDQHSTIQIHCSSSVEELQNVVRELA